MIRVTAKRKILRYNPNNDGFDRVFRAYMDIALCSIVSSIIDYDYINQDGKIDILVESNRNVLDWYNGAEVTNKSYNIKRNIRDIDYVLVTVLNYEIKILLTNNKDISNEL